MHPHPHWIDYAIIGIYFAFVLGIGVVLKKYMKTSTDFFLSGRSIPAWITGLVTATRYLCVIASRTSPREIPMSRL